MPEGQGLEYRDYFDYSEPVSQIPPHRVLAINRGDKEGPLKVRVDVSRPDLESVLFGQLPLDGHPHAEMFRAAAIDSLDRLILPSMEREVRRDLAEGAEKHAVEVFAKNLRGLLLQPPINKQVVLAIDPGFRTGCKLAVLDRDGNLLDHAVIYPHPPQSRRSEAKVTIKDLVGKHHVGVVAIGNGTACRETEELIAEIIAEGAEFSSPDYVPPPAPVEPPPQPERPPEPEASADHPGGSPHVAEHETDSSPRASEHGEPSADGEAASGSESTEMPEEHTPLEPVMAASEFASSNHAQVDPGHESHPSESAEPLPNDAPADGSDSPANPNSHNNATEAPVEMLPPISGGSPEATSSEPEGANAAAEPSPSESHSTAVLNQGEHGDEIAPGASAPAEARAHAEGADHPHAADQAPPEQTPPQATGAESHAEPAAVADEVAAGDPSAPTDHEPGGEPPSESGPAPESPPTDGASAASSGHPNQQRSRENKGGRPPRQGGQGRPESSKASRSARPRQSPPPPQEPPRPHPADALVAQLAYVVVNEAGASVYSTSQVGRDELPDLDATLRSGISIGRRLQDPLSELVKIEPQNIGVGLYQHDVNPKHLKETLESVISSCVNFVGVDLNTASVPLLRHVSGLNQLTARRIVEYRKEHGAFTSREHLKQIDGVGPTTFTQAAGFLKIPGARTRSTARGFIPNLTRWQSNCSRSWSSPSTWCVTRIAFPTSMRSWPAPTSPSYHAS